MDGRKLDWVADWSCRVLNADSWLVAYRGWIMGMGLSILLVMKKKMLMLTGHVEVTA